jgi:hypothetical protein
MKDMIDLILTHSEPASEGHLRQEIAAHTAAVLASARGGDRTLVQQAEEVVRQNPAAAFSFDSNHSATLTVSGHSWQAGHFELVSIGDLKSRADKLLSKGVDAKAHLWVLDGASPVTDIGALQATSRDTLFQVASQFNCLESSGPRVTNVANYFHDFTQGPRASISAFPATLLRHYRAPGAGGRSFVQQTDGEQIDLLADACGGRVSQNGYFTGEGINDLEATIAALDTQFDKLRVGVHNDVQVVLGYNWDGAVADSEDRRIAQVFTSTAAGGCYGAEEILGAGTFVQASRQLLRAAYLGTLLAAVCLGYKRVCLTLIGGGVFQNPINLIVDSIFWALDEVRPYLSEDLEVIVNGYSLGSQVNLDTIVPKVRDRGGAVLIFDSSGLAAIRR